MGENLYKCNLNSYSLVADIFASLVPLTAEGHEQLIKR